MLDYIFLTGIIGSLVLITGAAWPTGDLKKHPIKSTKNWFFAIGGLLMLIYAILNYLDGGSFLYVVFQILVIIASIMMMIDIKDKADAIIISTIGLGLIIWTLTMYEGHSTIIFILGLTGIGLGYTFQMGTTHRSLALALGSILIATFSYTQENWIFFWLNIFFAIFAGYYLIIQLSQRRK